MKNKITIKVQGYNKKQVKQITEKLYNNLLVQKKKEVFLKNCYFWYKPVLSFKKVDKKNIFFLPTKIKRVSMNRSPFIFKKSGETFVKKKINAFLNFTIKSDLNIKTNIMNLLFKNLKKELMLSNITLSIKIKKTVMVE